MKELRKAETIRIVNKKNYKQSQLALPVVDQISTVTLLKWRATYNWLLNEKYPN